MESGFYSYRGIKVSSRPKIFKKWKIWKFPFVKLCVVKTLVLILDDGIEGLLEEVGEKAKEDDH